MTQKKFRHSTILFDFDGTLTHSLPLWLRAYQHAFQHFGINLTDAEVVSDCFYRPWAEVVQTFGVPSVAQFGEQVDEGLTLAFEDAEPFDGVVEALEELQGAAVKLGIVTSCNGSVVKRFLKAKSMDSYWGTVVTADDITNFKPHPEPVLLALTRLNSDPADTMFIGDSAVDMLAADAVDLDKGLFLPEVHQEFYEFDDLRTHNPDFIFHNYDELIDLLSAQS
jgi:pyrophosphatase PpaX